MKNFLVIFLKIIFIVLILNLFIIKENTNVIYASTQWDSVFDDGKNFIQQGKNSNSDINMIEFQDLYYDIYNILLSIGIIITVIIGAILGIKFMFGSIEQQVKVKETLLPYLVGCIIIFGAFGIWKIVLIIASNVT